MGRIGGAGGCPTIAAGIVSPAGVKDAWANLRPRPRRSFRCRSRPPCDRLAQWARWWCWWLSNCRCRDCIARRCSKSWTPSVSAPDDHFAAGPHRRVRVAGGGRVGGAGGCPTVGAGIVSPASVQDSRCRYSAPDDHFAAGPDCRVIVAGSGRVGGAGGCPTVRAGIVSAAGVQESLPSSPPQTIISLPVHTAV